MPQSSHFSSISPRREAIRDVGPFPPSSEVITDCYHRFPVRLCFLRLPPFRHMLRRRTIPPAPCSLLQKPGDLCALSAVPRRPQRLTACLRNSHLSSVNGSDRKQAFPTPGILHILLKPLRLPSHIPPHLVFNALRRHKIAHKRPNYIGEDPRGPSQQLLSQARILPLGRTPPSLYHNISWRFPSSATTSAQNKAFLPPQSRLPIILIKQFFCPPCASPAH